MAKPDLDDGYLRYAHELDAALACADFTKGARIVLREVFSQIFGPARLKTAKLSPTDLSHLYESNKGNFGRAIKELVDSKALEKLGECDYRFLKDYEGWTKNGQPRLSDQEIRMAKLAPDRAMSFKKNGVVSPGNDHKPKQQTLPLDSVVSSDNDHQSDQQKAVVSSDNDRSQFGQQSSVGSAKGCSQFRQRPVVNSDNGALIEPACGIETLRLKYTHTDSRVCETKVLGPEYTEVGKLAIELTSNLAMGSWVDRMGHFGFSAAWIKSALEEGSAGGNLNSKYLHGILRRYDRDGTDRHPSSDSHKQAKSKSTNQPPAYVKGSLK